MSRTRGGPTGFTIGTGHCVLNIASGTDAPGTVPSSSPEAGAQRRWRRSACRSAQSVSAGGDEPGAGVMPGGGAGGGVEGEWGADVIASQNLRGRLAWVEVAVNGFR